MRIEVKDNEGRDLKIRIPNWIMMNYTSAFILHNVLKKKGISIKTKQIYKMVNTLKKYKKHNKMPDLIEIYSDDGESVLISL